MKKKLIQCSLLATVSATTAAYAGELGSISPQPATGNQVYGGVNLGLNMVDVEKKLNYPISTSSFPSRAEFTPGYNSFHGQLFAGYAMALKHKLSLAVEGDLDLYTGSSEYKVSNWFLTTAAQANEQMRYTLGLYLIPYYQLNEHVKLFIGPGISWGSFKVSYNPASTAGNLGVTASNIDALTGFALKMGTAFPIKANLDALLTYTYMTYSSMSVSATEPLSLQGLTGQYSPSTNLVMVGLAYHMPI